jgi:membrane protein implicated in regulation of membrane protease activity
MPLDRLVLILVIVIAAAGATLWLAAVVASAFSLGSGWPLVALIPAGMLAYVLWRVLADRLRNREDDRYDRIER